MDKFSDHLDSYNIISIDNKVVSERYHFNPWGNRKNPTNWSATDTRTSFFFDRGFTGHEHLDAFKIINMNARLYNPVIGRFFSPDPYVQAPESSQGFNRYSYCANNPLKYVDPSGELFDWVERRDKSSVYWNDNAISQETTPEGERYIGKTVAFCDYAGFQFVGDENGKLTRIDQSVKITADVLGANSDNILSKDAPMGVALSTTLFWEAAASSVKISQAAGEVMAQKVFRAIKVGSKATGVLGGIATTYPSVREAINNPTPGNVTSALIKGATVGVAFIPIVGWGISLGLGVADYFWGDKLYNKLDKK